MSKTFLYDLNWPGVSHVLRDKGILDAADQERLELLEHEVVSQ